MAYGTFTLKGTHHELGGETSPGPARSGKVLIRANVPTIRDSAGEKVMSGTVKATLDGNGSWSRVLPADDPSLNPSSGIVYTIEYHLDGEALPSQTLPAQDAGTTFDVADIVDEETVDGTTTVSLKGDKGDTGDAGPQGDPFPRGNRLVTMGDSISATSTAGPHGAIWTSALCELSQQRVLFGGNTATGGETSTQTLARVAQALALDPGIVTLTTGVNDILLATLTNLADGTALATFQGNVTAIHTAMQDAGVRLILTTIVPMAIDATRQKYSIAWNAWLRSFAAVNDVDLLDFADLLTDPVTGGHKAGYDSGDGLHPSQSAHIVMAQYASDRLLPTVPAFTPDGAHTAGEDANTNALDPTNLVKNPLLQHGGPTNWTWVPAAGHVGTLVTDAAFKGKAWRIVISGGSSTGTFSQFNAALIPVTAGKRYAVMARSRVDSSTVTPALFRGLRLDVWWNTGPIVTLAQPIAVARGSALWHFEVTVPVGVTGLFVVAILNDIPSGQDLTCHLGEFSLREIA